MNFRLRIWRQRSPTDRGRMVLYEIDGISPTMSFLDMLDVLNEQLVTRGVSQAH